jgi:phosphoribosylamine--glycine ligase
MAVSGGYPGSFERGYAITGLAEPLPDDSLVFHAGTKEENGDVVTSGGRVLCVTSYSNKISNAAKKSRHVLEGINFEGMYYRRDIGYEFD